MRFLIFLVLAVVATQAKYVMSPSGLSAAMERHEIEDEPLSQAAMLAELLYIPMARHLSCSNGACNAICQALGWKHGNCISDSTCRCYN